MRSRVVLMTLIFGLSLAQPASVVAQGTTVSDADCQRLRQRLTEHARLSEGVRRALAAQAGPAVATTPAPAAPAATGRAETIRARLQEIPKERQALEEQRLGAMMKLEFSRAGQIQGQIQALDTEKANLEREQASLGTAPAPAGSPAASPATTVADPVARMRCQDLPAAVESALKTRRRELGAREEQAGAIPLIALKGENPEQISQSLAAQFASGATASTQVGLLDADGNGQIDGFVDVPVPGTYRLVRQRTDGSMSFELFSSSAAGATPGYGDMARRLDETTARQSGQKLADLLASRPASAMRTETQTAEFAPAYAQYQAGNFTEAARLGNAAARTSEFQNLRGETVRVLELLSPVSGGVSLHRVVVLAQPNDQELWEETTTIVKPVSYWRTDVEVTRSRQTRASGGAVVGAPAASAPVKFSLER